MTPRNHVLICGPTGTGKSITMLSLNAGLMRLPLSRRPAMLWIDLHGSTTKMAAKMAVKWGVTPRTLDGEPTFIYDVGADTSRVPAYRIVSSVNEDLAQRIAENRVTVEELISVIMEAEGKLNAAPNPIILDGLTDALNLLIWQDPLKPYKRLTDLHHCFRISEQFRAFERDLTGPKRDEILRAFSRYHEADPRQWEFLCGPAVRRLKKIAESPQLVARCRENPLDMAAFFRRGGIYLYDGESRGNLSRADNALSASFLLLNAIQIARNGLLGGRELIVVLDEPVHGGILGLGVARCTAESRKWGLFFGAIAIQNPLTFADPRIGEELFANCKTTFVHKQTNPKACEFLAEMFAQRHFNALEVHFTEERTRYEEEDELEKLPTESVSEGPDGVKRVTKGFTYRTIKKPVTETVTHHKSGDTQKREYERILAEMRTGQVMIRDGDDVTQKPVDIPMPEEPWAGLWFKRHPRVSLADEKLRKALDFMRQREEYKASSGSPECPTPPPPSTNDAAARLAA